MAVALTPALSQREREIKERAARDFHGKAAPTVPSSTGDHLFQTLHGTRLVGFATGQPKSPGMTDRRPFSIFAITL
jgi:hypothetical protein